jgi:hypothetical protein
VQPTANSNEMASESMAGYIKQVYISMSMATLATVTKKRSDDDESSDEDEASFNGDYGEASDRLGL